MRWFGIVAACALGALGGQWACTLQLDISIVCGDGFVDLEAGEECDPEVPSSFEDACRDVPGRTRGEAACDPQTCEIIADDVQCATCGDDIADLFRDETCDGIDLRDARCPFDAGFLRCNADCTVDDSQCEACGNGKVDEGEECDFKAGSLAIEVKCAGSGTGPFDMIPPLPSPFPNKPYTTGEATRCNDDCTWSRLGCGYCGDGVIDVGRQVDFEGLLTAPDEVCDGDRVPSGILNSMAEAAICEAESLRTGLSLRENVICSEDCSSFSAPPVDAPSCCVTAGSACPNATSEYDCCYAYAHPEEAADQCEALIVSSGDVYLTCRPVTFGN
jgi:hypothetical protein